MQSSLKFPGFEQAFNKSDALCMFSELGGDVQHSASNNGPLSIRQEYRSMLFPIIIMSGYFSFIGVSTYV
jgi:hypothetical protein